MKTEIEVLAKARILMIRAANFTEEYLVGDLCSDGDVLGDETEDEANQLYADLEDTIRDANIILDNHPPE